MNPQELHEITEVTDYSGNVYQYISNKFSQEVRFHACPQCPHEL